MRKINIFINYFDRVKNKFLKITKIIDYMKIILEILNY